MELGDPGAEAVTERVADVLAFCRAFAMFERDAVCCGSVSVPQCIVLQTLREGTWDSSTLASRTRVTKGAMTRLVDGLQARGFVERVQSAHDLRRFEVQLTPVGRAEADRLARLTEQAVRAILERVPRERRAVVLEAAGLLRRAIEQLPDMGCCTEKQQRRD